MCMLEDKLRGKWQSWWDVEYRYKNDPRNEEAWIESMVESDIDQLISLLDEKE